VDPEPDPQLTTLTWRAWNLGSRASIAIVRAMTSAEGESGGGRSGPLRRVVAAAAAGEAFWNADWVASEGLLGSCLPEELEELAEDDVAGAAPSWVAEETPAVAPFAACLADPPPGSRLEPRSDRSSGWSRGDD
jgi:hypothetical protein